MLDVLSRTSWRKQLLLSCVTMWAWHFRSPFHFSGCQFCCPSHSSWSYSSENSGHFLLQLSVTLVIHSALKSPKMYHYQFKWLMRPITVIFKHCVFSNSSGFLLMLSPLIKGFFLPQKKWYTSLATDLKHEWASFKKLLVACFWPIYFLASSKVRSRSSKQAWLERWKLSSSSLLAELFCNHCHFRSAWSNVPEMYGSLRNSGAVTSKILQCRILLINFLELPNIY